MAYGYQTYTPDMKRLTDQFLPSTSMAPAPVPATPQEEIYAPASRNRGGNGKRNRWPGAIGDDLADNQEDAANMGRGRRDDGYPRNRRKRAVQQSLDELLAILSQQGHVDPAFMNMQLTDISRGTEATQNEFDEWMASMGLSGSGVGAATRGAIGAAGVESRSRAIAQEARDAAERRRQNLQLVAQLVLGPRISRRGQDMMLEAAKAGGGSNLGAYGNVLGGLGDLLGGFPSNSSSQSGYNDTLDREYNAGYGNYY